MLKYGHPFWAGQVPQIGVKEEGSVLSTRPTIEPRGAVPGLARTYSVRATSMILYASRISPTFTSWNFSMPRPHS